MFQLSQELEFLQKKLIQVVFQEEANGLTLKGSLFCFSAVNKLSFLFFHGVTIKIYFSNVVIKSLAFGN